jgi:hypothetical protein
MKKAINDKIQFVLYNIILGVIFWSVSSFITSWQRYTISLFNNNFLSLMAYMGPYLIFLWFIRITGKKSTWKPFNKYSDVIAITIIIIVCLILVISFSNLKISL